MLQHSQHNQRHTSSLHQVLLVHNTVLAGLLEFDGIFNTN